MPHPLIVLAGPILVAVAFVVRVRPSPENSFRRWAALFAFLVLGCLAWPALAQSAGIPNTPDQWTAFITNLISLGNAGAWPLLFVALSPFFTLIARKVAATESWFHTFQGGVLLVAIPSVFNAFLAVCSAGFNWKGAGIAVAAAGLSAVFGFFGVSNANPQGAVAAQRKAAALKALGG